MAFSAFTSLDDVLRKYQIRQVREEVVRLGSSPPPTEHYLAELRYTLSAVPFQRSEEFACEALIYPTLREVCKHYADHLTLFSHEPVEADAELRGALDYLVCKRSPFGPFTPDLPVLLVGEAKRDDLQKGWAQALAGMIAARRLDPTAEGRVLYGLSTTGSAWAFGRLEGDVFTQDPTAFNVKHPDELFGALHFVFAACRDQVQANPAA